jgi:hypothetical protein
VCLEIFRSQHGDPEVSKEGESDESDDEVLHSSQPFTKTDVESGPGEEGQQHGDKQQINHATQLVGPARGPVINTGAAGVKKLSIRPPFTPVPAGVNPLEIETAAKTSLGPAC